MPEQKLVNVLKEQIKGAIRRNSDRGFLPYSGCNRVCAEMMSIMQAAEDFTRKEYIIQAFEIYIMILLEAIRMVSHADTSSGAAGDVINNCLTEIDQLCKKADEASCKCLFDTITKASRNKAFRDWSEDGYRLLKCAAYFVRDQKQAQKIYDVFPILGTMYDGKDYPDKLLITLQIIERLNGKEAAEKYMMDNIHVPELRSIAIENALAIKNYSLVEKLCIEALEKAPGDILTNLRPGPIILKGSIQKPLIGRNAQRSYASSSYKGIPRIIKN